MTLRGFARGSLALTLILLGQSGLAKGLDLNDCQLLLAEPAPQAFAAWRARTLLLAERGEPTALELMAAQEVALSWWAASTPTLLPRTG